MSRINILSLETVGVDVKSNPLVLGNKKLHNATNIVFEEGVVRTRPGFRYVDLGVCGQVQGVCSYRPQSGLSAGTFGPELTGIALVVSGDLHFASVDGCGELQRSVRLTLSKTYQNKGAVHLFQAENHLIVQNPETVTMWWDGEGIPTISPGMAEQDWNDPETPWDEVDLTAPTAAIPDCDPPEQPWNVEVTVLEVISDIPIPYPLYYVDRLGTTTFTGVGDVDGKFNFAPREKRYLLRIIKSGYKTAEEYHDFRRPRNSENRDGCYLVDAAARTIYLTVYLEPENPGQITSPVPGP